METRHTPGPWGVAPFVYGDEVVNIVKDYKQVPGGASAHWIAELDASLDFDSDREAALDEMYDNARLIAAAPELLAACKMVASFAQSWQPLTPGDIRIMLDAIAKAEGPASNAPGAVEAPPETGGGALGRVGGAE